MNALASRWTGSIGFLSGFSRSLFIFMLAVVATIAVLLAMRQAGLDWSASLRDWLPGRAPEAGIISNIGIALTAISGCFLLFAAWKGRRFSFGLLACFCLLFAADDGLALHEELGDAEIVVFLLYGLLFAAAWYGLARDYDTVAIWPIAVVFTAFVTSVAADVFWNDALAILDFDALKQRKSLRYLAEDVPKFAGLVLLSLCAIGESLAILCVRRVPD